MGKERKLRSRDPGKGCVPEVFCRRKEFCRRKDQGNTVLDGSFPENCPVSALFWVCSSI